MDAMKLMITMDEPYNPSVFNEFNEQWSQHHYQPPAIPIEENEHGIINNEDIDIDDIQVVMDDDKKEDK